MENYTNPANAEVTDVIGEVSIDLAENTILQVGDIIQSGTTVNLANGSELILTFADGSQQRVSNSEGELVKEDIVDTVTTESELNAVEITDIDNLQNEIEAIQELIASGDDVDLPETAAGEVANEGTDFITLNRTGDETLAQAGYDTAEQDNAAPLPANFEADTINEQVPVVDPEPPVAEPEPPVAEPEPPVAEPEPPVAEPEPEPPVAEPEPEPPVAEPEPEPPVAEPEPEPPVAEPEPEPPVAEPEPEPPVAEPEPEPPVAEPEPEPPVSDLTDDNEQVEIAEDEVASGSVLTNASSSEAGLKVTSFSVDSDGDGVDETNYPVGVPVTIVDKGTLLLNENGDYTFTPLSDFNGDVPVVTYIVEDGAGDTNESTLTIVVTPVSDLTDDDEYKETAEGQPVSDNVLTNATSSEGDLTVINFSVDSDGDGIDETNYPVGVPVTIVDKGTLLLNENGDYTFTPLPDFNGDVPVITYIVEDGAGDTNESTLTIVVTPIENIPPVATDDELTINEGESIMGNVITHDDGDNVVDHDGGDGSTLTITQINDNDLTFGVDGYATVAVEGGTVTINAAGEFTYNNSDGYVLNDTFPSFSYTLSDGTDIAKATVKINIIDTAPIANPDVNVVIYEDYQGVTDPAGASGNVITGGSSSDQMDQLVNGSIKLVKFNYNGDDYIFDASNTSYTIDTGFGLYTMDNTGEYTFSFQEIPIDVIPSEFQIVYTIEDDDIVNPESDSTTLTIGFEHNLDSSSARPASLGQLIDLSYSEQENESSVINDNSIIKHDLHELFMEESGGSLDDYLSANEPAGNGEEMLLVDNNDLPLDNVKPANEEQNTEVIITNSFLKEGATLISDASPESVPQQIELDSTDQI
jgi:hypothetical protein